MEKTVFDLQDMRTTAQPPFARREQMRHVSTAVSMACIIGSLALLGVLLQRLPHQQTAVFQKEYALSAPEPISDPVLSAPTITVTCPPAHPSVIQLPPVRRSLWEIRAELKRGLGEWEFPHYVNAPHYGSGPTSPLPIPLRPRLASAWAE